MSRHAVLLASGAVVLALAGCAPGIGSATTPPSATVDEVTPVIGSVLFPPVPVEGSDDRTHLVYELLVTNYASSPVTLDRLDTLDAASGTAVGSIAAADLAGRTKPTGEQGYSAQLAGGQHAAVFLHVAVDAADAVPDGLVHELTVRIGSAPPVTERLAATTVDKRTLPVLSPPLRGEGYLAADGCCDAIRHVRAILPINGEPYLAQRYAIDWEQVDGDGRIYVGGRTDPASYAIYGDEAYAVADGTVVLAMDGLPDQVPGPLEQIPPLAEADGNFVVLDIGNGFYVNYAHLQPGSVAVRVGDRVSRGDVLGLVGNSGNSIAPHLHLHVMDTASVLAAQGLPYVVDAFTVTGQGASTADFDRAEADGIPLVTVPGVTPTARTDQMILDQSIVTLGGQR
ncbi:MAG: M23 family metallopeptidase [Pseudonocardia sp.]|nr:M23 family metallopeptidase [Pseudonocardia sp.]